MSDEINEEPTPIPVTETMPGMKEDTMKSYNVTSKKHAKKKFRYDRYATIKSVGMAFLDVALMVDSATRIRRVVDQGQQSRWYLPMIVLLVVLLALQLIECVLVIYLGASNIETPSKQSKLKGINITSTIFAGLIAILNVIVLQIMGDAGIYPMMSIVPDWNTTAV